MVNPRGNTPTVFRWKSSHGPFDHSSRHANFGGGHDIYVCDNPHANTSSYIGFPCSYEDTLGFGQATFTGAYNGWCVNEIEVFRVN
uniref:TLDc domain-containing protein n=1 Tax=Arcella intermedia TaxID=1963864 RepID=A0A6B2LNA3_9EUKA